MSDIQSFNIDSKHQHNLNNKLVSGGILLVGILIFVFILFANLYNNPYHSVNNTQKLSNSELIDMRNRDAVSNHLEFDFSYLKGCPHCNKMASIIKPGLQKVRKRHDSTIVLDSRPKQRRKYLQNNQIYSFPTLSVRYHGYLIYQYSGMSKKVFREIFRGENPYTHHQFKAALPSQSIRQNQFTERTTKEAPLSLTKAKSVA